MGWILPLAAAGLLVLAGIWAAWIWRRLRRLGQNVSRAFATLSALFAERHRQVPSLVEVLGEGAGRSHRNAALQACKAAMSAQGSNQQAASEGVLQTAIGDLVLIGEAHPTLRADPRFRALEADLARLDNRIAAARRVFNRAVADYNAALARRPDAFLAFALGFRQEAFFDVGETQRQALEGPPALPF
ncbi:LemA family protein [Methylobacterium organophilum]|uniref:LemA family protein n=1 Tax=Methylobacterium organophilum TaxID=410 RepID=UPI001F1344ED|nr:LemA family protein [Methylobacterium organophilum]UMY16406.1 LemA family protein [Methylobacterium organophilum]